MSPFASPQGGRPGFGGFFVPSFCAAQGGCIGAFDPEPPGFPNLVLWLDARDTGYLYQDDSKTVPVTTTGDPVGAWEDLSGNGNDALQATDADRPAYTTGVGPLGEAGVVFDGGNEYLLVSGISLSQPCTIAIIYKYDTAAHGQMTDGQGGSTRLILDNASDVWRMYAGTGVSGGTEDTNNHYLVSQFNGVSSSIRVDGAATASGDAGAQDATGGLTIGTNYTTDGVWFPGHLRMVLAYDNVLTGGQLASLEESLADL